MDCWAIIPVKEFDGAKHRLSDLLSPTQRRLLVETMLTDMLDAVAGSRLLAGVMIVTLDPHATALGEKIEQQSAVDGQLAGQRVAFGRLVVMLRRRCVGEDQVRQAVPVPERVFEADEAAVRGAQQGDAVEAQVLAESVQVGREIVVAVAAAGGFA